MNVSSAGSTPLDQIALSAVRRSTDQQETNGQNALNLIQSAAPEQLSSTQATQAVGEVTSGGIDTYA